MVAAERDARRTIGIDDGIAEMRALILEAYPGNTFSTERGEDPEGIDLQVEDELHLHVIPLLSPHAATQE